LGLSRVSRAPTWFQRIVLPGLAFKAVVIGGGYATGRELAEYFLPAGPWGGLSAMLLATIIWSGICIATFEFARRTSAEDYRSFFRSLLGRAWPAFEVTYILFVVLILAVFGAAAGAIVHAVLGIPAILGTIVLMVAITAVATFGNESVERLFKYVSILLYAVYAIFLALALTRFGDRIAAAFVTPYAGQPWAAGGVTYACYNIVGAVVILPVTRHLTSRHDSVVAGLVAGPLAMLPAVLFFLCMSPFMPGIGREELPSDFLLVRIGSPVFHVIFQVMIFAALLESGTGAVHAINERIAATWRRRGADFAGRARLLCSLLLLAVCMLLAERIGLVALIADGYRLLAYALIAVYVLPLLTIGLARLVSRRSLSPEVA
jgi:uncharacterized membrane protein YkvI